MHADELEKSNDRLVEEKKVTLAVRETVE